MKITSVLIDEHEQSQCCDWKLIPSLLKRAISSYAHMTDLGPNQTQERTVLQTVFNTPQYRTKEIQLGLLVVQSIDPCRPHTAFSPSKVTCTSWLCLWAPGWSVTEHLYLPEWLWVTQYIRAAGEPAGMMLWSVSVQDAGCWSHPPPATEA